MGMLDDRKRGAEERFRLEQEFEFKLTARRNRLFGKWAADTLGLTGNEADEYTKSVMFADLRHLVMTICYQSSSEISSQGQLRNRGHSFVKLLSDLLKRREYTLLPNDSPSRRQIDTRALGN